MHFTVGLDTYYKQSANLIDEGQFGAPIILTPFNYRYGKQYGAELTANYTTRDLTAYLNLRCKARKASRSTLHNSTFAAGSRLHRQQLHSSGPRAAAHRLGRSVLSVARHALQRRFPGRLRPARRSRVAARQDDGYGGTGIPNGEHLPYYTQVNPA